MNARGAVRTIIISPLIIILVATLGWVALNFTTGTGDWFTKRRTIRAEASATYLMLVTLVVTSSVHGRVTVVDGDKYPKLGTYAHDFVWAINVAEGETVTIELRARPLRHDLERVTASAWFVDRGQQWNRRDVTSPAGKDPAKPAESRYTTTG